jgi:hypothetical protein
MTCLQPRAARLVRFASSPLGLLLSSAILAAALTGSAVAEQPGAERITFERTQLDSKFRAEGVAVADLTGDGKADLAAGSVYYAAPDWKMIPFQDAPKSFEPKRYSNVFACFAQDINRDGRPDSIQVDFPGKQTWWYENPGKPDVAWKQHMAVRVTNNETPLWADLDGDGLGELIFGTSPDPKKPDGPERYMAWSEPGDDPAKPWPVYRISRPGAKGCRKYSHGLGVGDVNGDGHNDVVTPHGWWEAPSDPKQPEWEFHAAPLGEKAANMIVYDFDGDGDNDVLSSSAHAFGIWWHEQKPDGWTTHTIADDLSQTHAVCLADIDGDGLMDFVTGKRWWAHGGRDPGADMPALLCWFRLTREGGRPVWTRHVIDDDSGVGTQFQVADVNGDGLLDVAVANKKGVFLFEQTRP